MLVLDSEALSAAAHDVRARGLRVTALIDEARQGEEAVATSTAVLAEVVRGRPQDAAIHSLLRRHGIELAEVDRSIAIRAGQLLEATGSGSERAVDAFLVATADRSAPARILTGDIPDMTLLAAVCAAITVDSVDAP